MKQSLWTALLILLTAVEAEALREPQLCYILDGILFVYGIILTLLYCRLKMQYRKKSKPAPAAIYEKVDEVYTGLGSREAEAYATLEVPKSHPREQPPEEGELVG